MNILEGCWPNFAEQITLSRRVTFYEEQERGKKTIKAVIKGQNILSLLGDKGHQLSNICSSNSTLSLFDSEKSTYSVIPQIVLKDGSTRNISKQDTSEYEQLKDTPKKLVRWLLQHNYPLKYIVSKSVIGFASLEQEGSQPKQKAGLMECQAHAKRVTEEWRKRIQEENINPEESEKEGALLKKEFAVESSKEYEILASKYERDRDGDKFALARLYFIMCQITEGRLKEALESLEELRERCEDEGLDITGVYIFLLVAYGEQDKAYQLVCSMANRVKDYNGCLPFLEAAARCNLLNANLYTVLAEELNHIRVTDREYRVRIYTYGFLQLYPANKSEAEKCYEKATKVNSDDPLPYLAKYSCLDKENDTQECTRLLRHLIDLQTTPEVALTLAIDKEKLSNAMEEIIPLFKDLIKLQVAYYTENNPSTTDAVKQLRQLFEKAQKQLQQMTSIDGDELEWINQFLRKRKISKLCWDLAESSYLTNQVKDACICIDMSKQLDPEWDDRKKQLSGNRSARLYDTLQGQLETTSTSQDDIRMTLANCLGYDKVARIVEEYLDGQEIDHISTTALSILGSTEQETKFHSSKIASFPPYQSSSSYPPFTYSTTIYSQNSVNVNNLAERETKESFYSKLQRTTKPEFPLYSSSNKVHPLSSSSSSNTLSLSTFTTSSQSDVDMKESHENETEISKEDIEKQLKANGYSLSKINQSVKSESGTTRPPALIFFSNLGQLHVVKYLIGEKADPDVKDEYQATALMYAAAKGYEKIMACLIKARANLNLRDSQGNTAVMRAVMHWKEKSVQILTDVTANLRRQYPKDQHSKKEKPVSLALFNIDMTNQKSKIAQLVNNAKADLEIENFKGRRALHLAVIGQRVQHVTLSDISILKLLIEKGADIEAKDESGCTPLALAVSSGNVEAVELLIEKGANKEAKDRAGRTPLMLAATDQRIEAMMLLIGNGADIEAIDQLGRTPLMLASTDLRIKAMMLLIKKGTNKEAKDKEGRTALALAASNGEVGAMKNLIDSGADIEAKDDSGRTPFSLATSNGEIAAMEILISKGANINTKDKSGKTPLMYAVHKGAKKALALLINAKANLDLQDNQGNTALMIASTVGDPDAVEQLVKAGANQSIINNQRKSAWQLATSITKGYLRNVVEDIEEGMTERLKRLQERLKVTLSEDNKQVKSGVKGNAVEPLMKPLLKDNKQVKSRVRGNAVKPLTEPLLEDDEQVKSKAELTSVHYDRRLPKPLESGSCTIL